MDLADVTAWRIRPLTLQSSRSAPRVGEPVAVGVPFPPGVVWEASTLQLRSGDEVSGLQATVLERWPDGSLRWVLCEFRARWSPGAISAYELNPAKHASAPQTALAAKMLSPTTIHVDTGAVTFVVSGTSGFGLSVKERADDSSWASMCLHVADAQAAHLSDVVDDVHIESSGPLQTTVVVAGHVGEIGSLTYQMRLRFFADLAVAHAEITLRNSRRAEHRGGFWDLGDRHSQLLSEASLVITFRDAVDEVRCSPTENASLEAQRLPLEIYQESSAEPRRTPVIAARIGLHVFGAAMPYFWQSYPKRIAVDRSAAVLSLLPARFPERHELQAGEQTTFASWLGFGPDPVTDTPLDWCRDPLIVTVSPEQYSDAAALPDVAPVRADSDPRYERLVNAAIDGPQSMVHKREIVDEYGWRNFGELYADHEAVHHRGPKPLVSHYNNQYDGVAGFACQYMRTGDARWWRLCDELARHVVDIDIYHTHEDKAAYNGGLFWHTNHYVDAATATHRCYSRACPSASGGPSNEQNYTTGLMLHFLMTGCVASRDAVLSLAEWVVGMDDGARTPFRWFARSNTGLASSTASSSYHGPGRGAGNSINALLDAHRLTLDRRWLDKAEELIRRCIHPNDDIVARNLLDAERRWSYTVFLQVLGKYLDYKALRGELDDAYAYGEASLLHYARWMSDHERPYLETPAALEHPTETWAAQDIRKSEVFRLAARRSSGSERERFVERSRFFYEYAISTLEASPTRALTRPIVILLNNGYAHGRGLDAPPPPPPVNAFPSPSPFVPQRAIAMKRARVLAAAGAVLAVLALVWLLV